MTGPVPPGDLHDLAAELLEAHALDALDPDEAALVGAHLDAGCDDCEPEIAALRAVAERIGLGAAPRDPGDVLKRRVLREVEASLAAPGSPLPLPRAASVAPRTPPMGRLAALAAPWRPARFASMAASLAVVAVVLLMGWNVVLQGDVSGLDDENEALLATVKTVEEQQALAQQALADASEAAAAAEARSADLDSRTMAIVSVMGSDDHERRPLTGTEYAPSGAWGSMHINPKNGHFVVLASGLRAGIEGGYVLWLHAGDHHVPLCFFYVDGFGNGVGHGYLNDDISDALRLDQPRVRRRRPRTVGPQPSWRAALPSPPPRRRRRVLGSLHGTLRHPPRVPAPARRSGPVTGYAAETIRLSGIMIAVNAIGVAIVKLTIARRPPRRRRLL